MGWEGEEAGEPQWQVKDPKIGWTPSTKTSQMDMERSRAQLLGDSILNDEWLDSRNSPNFPR